MRFLKKDIDVVTKLIEELLRLNDIDMADIDIEAVSIEVLNICHSIGGGYGENTVRPVIESMIKRNMY